MKFIASGLVKEVSFSLIVYQVMVSMGYGRSYVVFLFYQLDLPGSSILIDVEQKSRIAGAIGLLSPFSCILSGTLMDIFGRKLYFFITFIPQIISWIIIALATNYDMLLYGMIIQGINIGMGFTTGTYVSEITTSSSRGALLGGMTVFYTFGATLCDTLMYFVSWRTVAWIYVGLSVFGLLSTLLLLESPVWLYNKGKKEAAVQALCSLRASNVNDLKNEIDDLEKATANKSKAAFSSIVKDSIKAWKPLLMSVYLQLLFQLSGYTVLFGYTILMFDRLRLPIDSSQFTILYSVAGVIGAICAPVFLFNMNRRSHLSLTAGIMAICAIVVAVYEEFFYSSDDKPCSIIISMVLYVYSWASNCGALPIAYTVCTEMFPSKVNGVLNGIFGATWDITHSGILKLYPTLITMIHIKIIIWSFTICCVLIVLFGIFILPETKGKTLNEVQEQYFQKREKMAKDENA